ncbi:WD40 repeat-like protein [Sistotremastrum niveocremeum HHB9708]|uniref:WD40 repeat-like protein n=1 Tax=Sistotremastrum niveocremeum HHB9708 TaxID=1314777 RepID=A0A164M6T5_9AGAM|nr:WD40 repeat-like protein [Sistotremastrum niveocremeum HHB9708]
MPDVELEYKVIRRLGASQSGPIKSLQFSADGQKLATGGSNGSLCIWSLQHFQLLHQINAGSPVLSLLWIGKTQILAGLGNGTLLAVSETQAELYIEGHEPGDHGSRVEFIAADQPMEHLAVGGGNTISLWSLSRGANSQTWKTEPLMVFPSPPIPHTAVDKAVVVTGIHWDRSSGEKASRKQLFTGFLHHGIILSSVVNQDGKLRVDSLRVCLVPSELASFSFSPDYTSFVIADLKGSFTLLQYPSNVEIQHFEPHDPHSKRLIPSAIIHGGNALLGANKSGRLMLWDCVDGDCLQVLSHEDPVHVFTAFYDEHAFWIASGTSGPDTRANIYLWHVAEPGSADNTSTKLGSSFALTTFLTVVPPFLLLGFTKGSLPS